MALSEGETLRVIKKFRGHNFYHWKKKMKLLFTSLDLWDIVDESEVPPSDNADIKVKKEYKRHEKKAFGMIATNLDDANFSHVIACNGLEEAWKTFCNIYESRNLANFL